VVPAAHVIYWYHFRFDTAHALYFYQKNYYYYYYYYYACAFFRAMAFLLLYLEATDILRSDDESPTPNPQHGGPGYLSLPGISP
jgi:hypothetical protein